MFNLKTFTFDFPDISIHCVGSNNNVNMLYHFYSIHKNHLDPDLFLKRILSCNIFACYEGRNPLYTFQVKKYNDLLKRSGALFNIDYLEEAMLLADPHKIIKVLELEELYGKELDISPYLQNCFPNLPPKYIIAPPKD